MPAEVISSSLLPNLGVESVVLMDDYGTESRITIPVSESRLRAGRIADAIKIHTAKEAQLEQYAKDHEIDLSAQKRAGLTKKAEAKTKAKGKQ